MTERERVEEVRLFFRLKKKEFAELLGHAYPQNYSNYLKGKSNLSIKMLKSIKEHNSNINTDWLLYGEGQMLTGRSSVNSQNITNNDGTISQISNNGDNTTINNSNELGILKNEVVHLRKEIEHLKKSLEDKEEIIRLLKR